MYKSTENDKFLTDRDIQTKVYFTIEAIKDNSNGVIIIQEVFQEKEDKTLVMKKTQPLQLKKPKFSKFLEKVQNKE